MADASSRGRSTVRIGYPVRRSDGTFLDEVSLWKAGLPGIQTETHTMLEAQPTVGENGESIHDHCPFLKPAMADWLWPVEGICRARVDGRLMVPPVPHYLHLCTTKDHQLCEVFRARFRPPDQAAA